MAEDKKTTDHMTEDGSKTDAAARARVGAGIGEDPGGPGGMGGVHGGSANPDHRPGGGVSPIEGPSGDNDRH